MRHGTIIPFAHILRGVAALIVLIGHFTQTFWLLPSIPTMIGATEFKPTPNYFIEAINGFVPLGAMGHYGVALFFLISGFVIPFSLLNRTRIDFALGRILRLWPTYVVGLLVTIAFIIACSTWFAQPLPFPWSTLLYQLIFVRDLLWVQSIDGIVWTLEIEAKFYILMAMLAPVLRRGRLGPLAATTALILILTVAASNLPGWIASGDPFYRLLYGLTLSGQMICFMLIGVVFNFLHRGLVSVAIAIVAIAFFFTAFAIQWPLGPIRSSSSIGVWCYATALATFGLMFVLRGRIRAPKALSWLADISYPLYVIHGFAGYVIMRVLYDLGVSVAGCIAIACAFSFLAAQVLHVLVERPSQDLARSIQVGRLFRREAAKVALGGDRPQAFR